jgi:hypothetical protein
MAKADSRQNTPQSKIYFWGMGGCTNQVKWLSTTIRYGITLPSPCLAKYSLLTKWHLISHYVKADPGQLVA